MNRIFNTKLYLSNRKYIPCARLVFYSIADHRKSKPLDKNMRKCVCLLYPSTFSVSKTGKPYNNYFTWILEPLVQGKTLINWVLNTCACCAKRISWSHIILALWDINERKLVRVISESTLTAYHLYIAQMTRTELLLLMHSRPWLLRL